MKKCVVWCVNEDKKAQMWLAHSMKSFIEHGGDTVDKFVLTNDPDFEVERFTASTRVIQIGKKCTDLGLDELMKHKWQGRTASPMMMGRLIVPFLEEFKDYDRVLYLDLDTDIISDRFLDIFDEDIADYDCGMSRELYFNAGRSTNTWNMHPMARHCRLYLWANMGCTPHANENYKRLERGIYFNSGVIIMNTERMRKTFGSAENVCRIAIDMLRAQLKLMDQDVINSVCTIKRINSAYNCFFCTHDDGDFVYCMHNAGGEKVSSQHYPVFKKEMFK